MLSSNVGSIAIVVLIAAAAPVISAVVGRVVTFPLVVFEIVLGIMVGPAVLNLVHPDDVLATLSNFGLAMLFFMAGNEIDFARLRGRPLTRASVGWLGSLVVAVAVSLLLAHGSVAGVYVGIALTSTALGTLMPILRDAGRLGTPFGTAVTAVGAAGEFGPLLAISLFLSGRSPGLALAILIGFVLIVALAIFLALRSPSRGLTGLVSASLRTSGQFAVRLVILIVVALVCLSLVFGLDILLGAFAAGVLSNALLRGVPHSDLVMVEAKLEAVSFGFFVPIFFIMTGVTFDLRALLASPTALVLLPIFLLLMLVVRGLPAALVAPPGSSGRERGSLVLFAATGLPIIVAVTQIGVAEKELAPSIAAALVGAGMLSVLLFPLLALVVLRSRRPATVDA